MGTWLGRIWSARTVAVPRREGWSLLVVSLTGYLMCACVLATAVAKGDHAYEMGIEWPTPTLVWSLLSDVLVFLGLAGLFALAESRWSRAVWVTGPIAVVVAIYVALNTAYLIIAGEQGSWQVLQTFEKQFDDVEMVLEEAMSPAVVLAVVGTAVALIAVPIGLRRLAARRFRGRAPAERGRLRVQAAVPVAALAGFGLVALPGPGSVQARSLGDNCVVKFVRTAASVLESGSFEGYPHPELVDEAAIAQFVARDRRPNVVLLVLESTRYDHTSLAGEAAFAQTPNLAALADRGLSATRARAVVPHTTKSLFAMLCARFPTMQRGTIEVVDDNPIECLPQVLAEAGYHTGFFQSAFGTFEKRPRLVARMGFGAFESWETIRGRKLGYLASDDASLFKPFERFVDDAGSEPFFATLLTSAPHHPYRLPGAVRKRARKRDRALGTDQERYARLVEAEDELLGRIMGLLDERGLTDDTIVIVVGDHGEGFGDHGIKQHDNNFYEEGLHVPFVFAGPGVPRLEYAENVSLIDLAPTLMGRLGLPVASASRSTLPGYDLFSNDFPGDSVARPFACYSSWKCRGFVLDRRKVVYVPEDDEVWYFDLGADPDELEPRVLTDDLENWLEPVHEAVNAHRTRDFPAVFIERSDFGDWRCLQRDGVCLHPRAYKTKYRYIPDRGSELVAPDATTGAGETSGTEEE